MPMSPKVITAEEEYRKCPDLKKEDINHLREWVSKQTHLPHVSEEQLILFLHSCYYSLEKAKKTIECYYTVKTHSPELFSDRDPTSPEFQKVWNVIDSIVLPKKTEKEQRVVFSKLRDHDASNFDLNESTKLFFMVVDLILREEGTADGFVFLFDMTGVSMGHIAKLIIATLKKFFVYIQGGFPLRMKAVHVIHTNPLIDKVMFLIRPLMNKELADMLNFHQGIPKEFLDEIPQALLPKDYGGNMDSIDDIRDSIKQRLESQRDWFKADDSQRVDESKRSGSVVNEGTLFGVEGSFKKLSID